MPVKLQYLDEWTEKRRDIARAYASGLDSSMVLPNEMPWAKHVYHLFVIRTPERDQLKDWLESKGISAGLHYPVPVHLQDAWREMGGVDCSLPVTEKVVSEILSLPIYPELTAGQLAYVVEKIKEFYS